MRAALRRRPVGPSAPPAVPGYSQDEQRTRRRGWLRVHYDGQFDLAAEVSAIVGPLATSLSALPRPGELRRDVDSMADAVHELVTVVVGLLAEFKHADRAAHARIARAVADLAQRPTEPQISDAQLCDGSWATLLVSHVAPYAADFAAVLGRALPPEHPQLLRSGHQSASERLETALRALDLAALDMSRRIPKAARYQGLPSMESRNAARRAERDAQRARNQLAKMGIEAPTT